MGLFSLGLCVIFRGTHDEELLDCLSNNLQNVLNVFHPTWLAASINSSHHRRRVGEKKKLIFIPLAIFASSIWWQVVGSTVWKEFRSDSSSRTLIFINPIIVSLCSLSLGTLSGNLEMWHRLETATCGAKRRAFTGCEKRAFRKAFYWLSKAC